MPNTVVLDPILDEEDKALGIQNFHKIAKMLSEMKSNDSQEFAIFDDFLCKLDMYLASYLQSIRSTLYVSKKNLKRTLKEVRINSYNKTLLK